MTKLRGDEGMTKRNRENNWEHWIEGYLWENSVTIRCSSAKAVHYTTYYSYSQADAVVWSDKKSTITAAAFSLPVFLPCILGLLHSNNDKWARINTRFASWPIYTYFYSSRCRARVHSHQPRSRRLKGDPQSATQQAGGRKGRAYK